MKSLRLHLMVFLECKRVLDDDLYYDVDEDNLTIITSFAFASLKIEGFTPETLAV